MTLRNSELRCVLPTRCPPHAQHGLETRVTASVARKNSSSSDASAPAAANAVLASCMGPTNRHFPWCRITRCVQRSSTSASRCELTRNAVRPWHARAPSPSSCGCRGDRARSSARRRESLWVRGDRRSRWQLSAACRGKVPARSCSLLGELEAIEQRDAGSFKFLHAVGRSDELEMLPDGERIEEMGIIRDIRQRPTWQPPARGRRCARQLPGGRKWAR